MGIVHSELIDTVKELDKLGPVKESDAYLIEKFKEGNDECGFLLFRKHYRMILKVILSSTKHRWYSDDCLQAGAVGLYEAAKRYNPKLKFKFLTYAVPWIRKYALEEICNDTLPAAGVKFSNSMKDRLFRFVGNKMTGMSKEAIMEKMRINEAEYASLVRSTNLFTTPLELDADVTSSEADAEPSGMQLEVSGDDNVEETAIESESKSTLLQQIQVALEDLNEMERFIVLNSLDLLEERPLKWREVAKKYRLSCQDVTEVKREAFRKLKVSLISQGVQP